MKVINHHHAVLLNEGWLHQSVPNGRNANRFPEGTFSCPLLSRRYNSSLVDCEGQRGVDVRRLLTE